MATMNEIGRLGQKRYGGIFYEEFLRELQGKRGMAVYQEMAENDDVIGAILFSIENLIRQATWDVQPGGTSTADEEAKDFVLSCMDDMSDTWSDTISEILSFLTYGWSAHEIVYKRRCGKRKDPRLNSKYTDNLIGWQKLPIRSQDTLYEWEYDDNDNVTGLVQNPPPDFGLIHIPVDKLLLFRTKSRKGNPEGRSILRNAYRCFDAETEILTSDGWKKGIDLTGKEALATLNPTTLSIEYQVPSEIHRYQHDGDLIHFESRFLDIAVTDNHRMWVQKHDHAPFSFVDAADVKKSHRFMRYGDWIGEEKQSYTLPELYVEQTFNGGTVGRRLQYEAATVKMDDWLAFLALYLTEGCAYKSRKGQKLVSIAQKEGGKADAMREVFARLPFHVYEHKQEGRGMIAFEFCNAQLYRELKPFGKSGDKYVPKYVKKLSARQIKIFLDWYAFGDGMQMGNTAHGYEGTTVLGTISKTMADDLQELALKAGYEGQISVDAGRNAAIGKNPFYKVSLCKRRGHKAKEITRREYHGTVWCPTTQNGIVYVRRNGKPAWVGNCWYFKRRIQEIEGIGIERDLAGFPTLTAPENLNIWDEDDPDMVAIRLNAERIVQNIRRDSLEGVVMPNGWELKLLSTGGQRQFNTSEIIERYDSRIAMTTMADFILLGHQSVGSFALSSNKTKMFSMAIGSYLDIICEVFNNKAIPALIDINGDHFSGITDYPYLTHSDVEDADLEKLGNYINQMVGCGVLIPDEGLEDFAREQAGMPERVGDWEEREDTSASDGGTDENGNQNNPTTAELPNDTGDQPPLSEDSRRETEDSEDNGEDEANNEEDEDDDDLKKAIAARKHLGRK